MMNKKLLTFFVFVLISSGAVTAQPSLYKMKAAIDPAGKPQPGAAQMNMINPTQAGIVFTDTALRRQDATQWLSNRLQTRPGIDAFTEEGTATKAAGNIEVTKLHQYYKGIKVEHGVVKTTSRNGNIATMQLEYYAIGDQFSTTPAVTERAALQKAAQVMGVPDSLYNRYGSSPQIPLPTGQLVIVRTYDDDSTVCLAWKFEIFNEQSFTAANLYVNAQTGKIVLKDDLIHHSNINGTATTRYSGTQTIVTDNGSTNPGKPYRLQQTRNGHSIVTLNYEGRQYYPAVNNPLAIEFTDDNNTWTTAEHGNTAQDDVALDVHLGMQIISDYWKTVHSRNSWDNANSPLRSYVHVGQACSGFVEPDDNASWYQGNMYFGDGTFGTTGFNCATNDRPFTALDISAHEVGHGICDGTANLIYRWESGALNEGFSDIWGSMIEKWGIEQNPSIGTSKTTWLVGEEITSVVGTGLRNMQDPGAFNDPSTYGDANWKPSTYLTCPSFIGNDNCGVHSNSGVLNKWFFLITDGETSTNLRGISYSVTGMGAAKSSSLAYLTELNLTPNSGYSTAKAVSMEAVVTLFGAASAEVQTVRDAWRAVGIDSAIYDMANTPAFTTNNFTSISIGKDTTIWAGTDKQGLYVYSNAAWVKRSEIPNVRVNDIKVDKNGGIWIAQSGTTNSGMATAGGVNYFAAPTAAMTGFYTVSTQTNVPTRNVRSIFVDQTRFQNGTNPRVWIATNTYINSSGVSASGKPALGFNTGSPNFQGINDGVQIASGTGGVTAIGGDKNTVWSFAANNIGGKNQILAYNAATGGFIQAYDNSTVSTIPAVFTVNAIYTDALRRTWFGLGTNAVLVYDEFHVWHYLSFPGIFQVGSIVNNNAITGTKNGDVYIGTTNGLVFFDRGAGENIRLDDVLNYRRYTRANGLPGNNITGIAYDAKRFKVWIATSQGICQWDPLCLGSNCGVKLGYSAVAATKGPGNWSDTAIWEEGRIPDSTTIVIIEHNMTVDINAHCQSLSVFPGANITVSPGIKLTIYRKEEELIQGGQRRSNPR